MGDGAREADHPRSQAIAFDIGLAVVVALMPLVMFNVKSLSCPDLKVAAPALPK